ncbi:hypothetical protein SAZ11_01890 [Streptomyces sp. FXJ1.4098]|nr:hypothetical protein [Streptomyces sp. FXJ1.4098]
MHPVAHLREQLGDEDRRAPDWKKSSAGPMPSSPSTARQTASSRASRSFAGSLAVCSRVSTRMCGKALRSVLPLLVVGRAAQGAKAAGTI